MQYEVVIRVRMTGKYSDELHSLREVWEFTDNPKLLRAGHAYVIEQTAKGMVDRIREQINNPATSSENFEEDGERPRRK